MDLLRVLVTIRRHAYDCWRCLYLWFILQLETFLHPSLHYNTIYQSSTLNSRGIVIKNAIWECGTNGVRASKIFRARSGLHFSLKEYISMGAELTH